MVASSQREPVAVRPLMAAAYTSIYFDDIFRPDTLTQLATAQRDDCRAMDLFFPERVTRDIALFLIHGGGWHSGSRHATHNMMRARNAEGYICASTDYILSDRGNILEQLRDVRHGYELFLRILAERGRPRRVVVAGSSAGAHLALLLALAAPGECGEALEFGAFRLDPSAWVKPVGAYVQSMPATLEPGRNIGGIDASIERVVKVPYGQDPEAYRRVSPIEYVRPGSPPVFHLASDRENYFPVALADEFIAKMQRHGCGARQKIYAAEHGFFYDVVRPEQQEAFRDVGVFLEELEGKQQKGTR